jgi:hypothetical protein
LTHLTNQPISRNVDATKPEWQVDSSSADSDLLYFAERGSGRPLLLVHGLMITGEMFEPVIDRFAAWHRVIVPDLRGHGRSRALPPTDTVSQVASDLSLLLDRLRRLSGGARLFTRRRNRATTCPRPSDPMQPLGPRMHPRFQHDGFRERIEGYLIPILINILGMRRLAKLVISQG